MLERLGSTLFFYKSNFPALFSNQFLMELSMGKFDLYEVHADPSRLKKNYPLANWKKFRLMEILKSFRSKN